MKGKEEIGYVGVLVAHLVEEEGDVPYKKSGFTSGLRLSSYVLNLVQVCVHV